MGASNAPSTVSKSSIVEYEKRRLRPLGIACFEEATDLEPLKSDPSFHQHSRPDRQPPPTWPAVQDCHEWSAHPSGRLTDDPTDHRAIVTAESARCGSRVAVPVPQVSLSSAGTPVMLRYSCILPCIVGLEGM